VDNKIVDTKHKEDVHKMMLDVENAIAQLPGAVFGDSGCPLKHSYGDGCYIREIFMRKGMLLTSKIHKKQHPYFVLSGDVSVYSDTGTVRIKAPYYGITEPGTKRVLYTHEDTVWVTVHVTDKKDLKDIEEEIIAKTFDDILPVGKENIKLEV